MGEASAGPSSPCVEQRSPPQRFAPPDSQAPAPGERAADAEGSYGALHARVEEQLARCSALLGSQPKGDAEC